MSRRRVLAALAGAAWLAAATVAGAAEDVGTIPTRPGVTQSFMLVRPSGPPPTPRTFVS